MPENNLNIGSDSGYASHAISLIQSNNRRFQNSIYVKSSEIKRPQKDTFGKNPAEKISVATQPDKEFDKLINKPQAKYDDKIQLSANNPVANEQTNTLPVNTEDKLELSSTQPPKKKGKAGKITLGIAAAAAVIGGISYAAKTGKIDQAKQATKKLLKNVKSNT